MLLLKVLSPWNDPVPLTRGWCLFELYCTIITNSKFDIAMSDVTQKQFLQDITKGKAHEEINKMLEKINVEKSNCNFEKDRDSIFEIVRKEVGFSEINKLIFQQMRQWVISTTTTAMYSQQDDDVTKLLIMNSLAILLVNQGIVI